MLNYTIIGYLNKSSSFDGIFNAILYNFLMNEQEQTNPIETQPEPIVTSVEVTPTLNSKTPMFWGIFVVVLLIGGYLLFVQNTNPDKGIVTYEGCVSAGNPVMESFPEQCITKDGVHFTHWRVTDQGCIQVITPAKNPETEEIREFPTPCDVPSNWEKVEIIHTSDWQTYRNEEFEFEYPDNFVVRDNEESVTLNHGVPYTHNDVCDFRGDSSPLNEVIDFNATLQVFNKDVESTVEATYFSPDDVIENGEFKLSPGFVDVYSVGSLNGHRFRIGAEGCGINRYYFPLGNSHTLVVTQSVSPERTPLILDYKKYLDLPGILSPEEEDKMFDQILSTFKFIE